MKIHSLQYSEHDSETYAWTLDDFSLIDVNLIVGINATGKSRVLRVINGLARLVEGAISPSSLTSCSYRVVLKEDQKTGETQVRDVIYSLNIREGKVQAESLEIEGVSKLSRGVNGRGKLYFEKNSTYIDVQIPESQLALASRRVSEQHGFFEQLHHWANSVKYYECARTETSTFTGFEGKLSIDAVNSAAPLQSQLHLIIKLGIDKFQRDFISAVIGDMKKVGYQISDFGLMPATGVHLPPIQMGGMMQTMFVRETNINKRLAQNELSDGMLRAFSTLVYLHFIRLLRKRGCFLIDDIGEGLDFERATKLIAVVIGWAEHGYVQVVMTTNDRFVMNNVPLSYWSVIHREGGNVSVYNPRNSAERFKEFEEFGFNNFDFFAKRFFRDGVEI